MRAPSLETRKSMHATTFIAVLIVLLAGAVLVVPLAGEAQQAASSPA